jgi:hypothetical protein
MAMKPPSIVGLGVHWADDGRLRPVRRLRAEALAKVRGIGDPAAAWIALGYAPDPERLFRLVADEPAGPDWVDASRSTANLDGGPSGVVRCAILDRPHPHGVDEAVAFAADAPNIAIVERLAREHAASMEPWSFGASASRVAWRFLRVDASIPRLPGSHDLSVVGECLEQALERAGSPPPYEGGRVAAPLGTLWRDVSERGLLVPSALEDPYFLHGALGAPFVPEAVRERRFADLANPFRSLDGIAALGYQLENVVAGVITMIAAAPVW